MSSEICMYFETECVRNDYSTSSKVVDFDTNRNISQQFFDSKNPLIASFITAVDNSNSYELTGLSVL